MENFKKTPDNIYHQNFTSFSEFTNKVVNTSKSYKMFCCLCVGNIELSLIFSTPHFLALISVDEKYVKHSFLISRKHTYTYTFIIKIDSEWMGEKIIIESLRQKLIFLLNIINQLCCLSPQTLSTFVVMKKIQVVSFLI